VAKGRDEALELTVALEIESSNVRGHGLDVTLLFQPQWFASRIGVDHVFPFGSRLEVDFLSYSLRMIVVMDLLGEANRKLFWRSPFWPGLTLPEFPKSKRSKPEETKDLLPCAISLAALILAL
jgi:hypothetical protein